MPCSRSRGSLASTLVPLVLLSWSCTGSTGIEDLMADVTFVGDVGAVDLAGMVSSEVRVVAHGDNDCAQGPHAVEAEGSLKLDGSYVVVVPLPRSETLCAEINISANFPPLPHEPGSSVVNTGISMLFGTIYMRDINPVPGLVVAVETPRITINRPPPE